MQEESGKRTWNKRKQRRGKVVSVLLSTSERREEKKGQIKGGVTYDAMVGYSQDWNQIGNHSPSSSNRLQSGLFNQ